MRNTTICPVCQCTFCDSDCVQTDGSGQLQDPVKLSPILDDVDGNLLECGPSGFAAFLPDYLSNPPSCNIYSALDQPVPYDTVQILQFTDERYDTDSMHDKNGDLAVITFKTAGVYLITLNFMWKKPKTGTTGDIAAFIRKNGSTFIALISTKYPDPDVDPGMSLSVEEEFAAGDYVEAMAKQDAVRNGKGVDNFVLSDRNTPIFCATFLRLPT